MILNCLYIFSIQDDFLTNAHSYCAVFREDWTRLMINLHESGITQTDKFNGWLVQKPISL